MRVIVVFEFKYVHPDSKQADKIVEEITESCETMRIGFNATECWAERPFLPLQKGGINA